KSISVTLKRLPTDADRIYRIVRMSYIARQERLIDADSDYLFENMEALTVYSTEPLDPLVSARLYSSQMDYAVSIRTKDGVEQFVDIELEMIPAEMSFHPSNINISSGNIHFGNVMKRRKENGCIELKLSDGLVFIPPQPDYAQAGKITISYQDNLDMHLKDLEFFL